MSKMRLEYKPQAFEDLQYWVKTNPKMAKRLLRLIYPTSGDRLIIAQARGHYDD